MALVQIDPEASEYSYLKGGIYGPGLDLEAKCVISKWQHPREDDLPGDWGKFEGKTPADFCSFQIKVFSQSDGLCTIFHDESIGKQTGSRIQRWLTALGISMSDDGTYDTDDLEGLECIVEVGDPYQSGDGAKNPGQWNTGNLKELLALPTG